MVTSVPPVSSATALARSRVWQLSRSPWITSTGQRTRSHIARASSSLAQGRAPPRPRGSATPPRPRAPSWTQSSICFVECGSGICWAKKNSRKPLVVAAPVVEVALRPALVGVERHVRRELAVVRMRRRQPGHERRDRRDAEHRRRMRSRRASAPSRRRRRAPPRSASCAPLASSTARPSATYSHQRVGLCVARTVGPAVPARVERDDAEVAREVRDLRLPEPRVRDRRRREEQERRRCVSVDLVEDAHAVALDEALLVGVAGAGLLACRPRRRSREPPTNSRRAD